MIGRRSLRCSMLWRVQNPGNGNGRISIPAQRCSSPSLSRRRPCSWLANVARHDEFGGSRWLSGRSGYRHDATDPHTSRLWPALPDAFGDLTGHAEHAAGVEQLVPDARLTDHYAPGARLSRHQDRNDRDFNEPIVLVPFGAPATLSVAQPHPLETSAMSAP